VGETDFHFGSGSLLTTTKTQAVKSMAFVRPAATAPGGTDMVTFAPAAHRETFAMQTVKSEPFLTMSADLPAAADLLRVAHGGTQMTLAVGHWWR
jgi:hypothetical protein